MDKCTWHGIGLTQKKYPDSHCICYIQDGLEGLNIDLLLQHVKVSMEELREHLGDLLPTDIPILIVNPGDFVKKTGWPYKEGVGICAREFQENKPYQAALVVSSSIVDRLPSIDSATGKPKWTRNAEHENFIHEIAHVLHSQYYTICSNNSVLSEGLAELIPEYILGFEKDSFFIEELTQFLLEPEIEPKNFSLKALNKNGFSSDLTKKQKEWLSSKLPDQLLGELSGQEKDKALKRCYTQDSPAYQSAYLIMRGLIRRFEEEENCKSNQALKKIFEYLKNVNAMPLKEQLDYLSKKIPNANLTWQNLYDEFSLQNKAYEALKDDAKKKEPKKIQGTPQQVKGKCHG